LFQKNLKNNQTMLFSKKINRVSAISILILAASLLSQCEKAIEQVVAKDDNGNIISIYDIRKADGKKHGAYQLFNAGKLVEKGNFADDLQDGVRQLFNEKKIVVVEEAYEKGKLRHRKTFFENGKLQSEGQYDAAVAMAGEWKYYYQNGNPKEIVTFKNNIEDGVFKEYYENGKLKAEGSYIPLELGLETTGLEQGILKEYDENGTFFRKKMCEKGRCSTIWELNKE
jgi:antitoxin component YwqK of YwqJK toxin-antitoxin module